MITHLHPRCTCRHRPGMPCETTCTVHAPVVDSRGRLRELERTPKAALARLHVANGGQMGLPTYLKWSKDELVRIVAEDEGIDPWSA